MNQFVKFGHGTSNTLPTGVPNGYLKAVFFDKAGNVQAAESQVKYLQTSVSSWQTLELSFTASQNGYLQVYVANESDQEVFFDELEVAHTPTLIAQENHYYPYGMNMVGIEKQGMPHHRFQFNAQTERETAFGLHWDETPFRRYDAQIGRFHGVDALASSYAGITPYQYGFNNPVMFNDPSGLSPNKGGQEMIDWAMGQLDGYNRTQYNGSVAGTGGDLGYVEMGGAPKGGYEDEAAMSHVQANNRAGNQNDCCGWIARAWEGFVREAAKTTSGILKAVKDFADQQIFPMYGPSGPGIKQPPTIKNLEDQLISYLVGINAILDKAYQVLKGNPEAVGGQLFQSAVFAFFRGGTFGVKGNLITTRVRHLNISRVEVIEIIIKGSHKTPRFVRTMADLKSLKRQFVRKYNLKYSRTKASPDKDNLNKNTYAQYYKGRAANGRHVEMEWAGRGHDTHPPHLKIKTYRMNSNGQRVDVQIRNYFIRNMTDVYRLDL